MSRLEELIQQYCPDGVEYMAVGCVSEIKRGERLTKSSLKTDGEYIVVSGGVSPMGRYTNYNRNENTIIRSRYKPPAPIALGLAFLMISFACRLRRMFFGISNLLEICVCV